MKKLWIVLCLVFLAACTPPSWQLVETSHLQEPSGGFAADFPVGWAHFSIADTILASRDGVGLHFIKVHRWDLDKAFQQTKSKATAEMLPSELADAIIGELKADSEVIEILDNRPAQIDGSKGVRLYLRFASQEGLRFDEVIYAFVDPQGLYALNYHAPTLHYFERDLGEFEKVVKSFKRTPGKEKKI